MKPALSKEPASEYLSYIGSVMSKVITDNLLDGYSYDHANHLLNQEETGGFRLAASPSFVNYYILLLILFGTFSKLWYNIPYNDMVIPES